MRIIYVAKHGSGGGDDEGAISHALEELGYEVIRVQENQGLKALGYNADMLLFHKWEGSQAVRVLQEIKAIKVFWYFDLVDFPDPTLRKRCEMRKRWIEKMTPLVDIGFCTDGDWVANQGYGKLVHLTQGADERFMGFGDVNMTNNPPPILFMGTRNGGQARASHIDELTITYRQSFNHVTRGVHGRRLADLIAASQIVVAPDGPVSDRYWSNRVYLTLGFGGFLLHPYCQKLKQHYTDGEEIVYYRNREDLYKKIKYYFDHPEERKRIQSAGYLRTKREHTYRLRCGELITRVRKLKAR